MEDSKNVGRAFREICDRLESVPWTLSEDSPHHPDDEKVFCFREEGITASVRFFGVGSRGLTGANDFEGVVSVLTELGTVVIRMPNAVAERAGKAALRATGI